MRFDSRSWSIRSIRKLPPGHSDVVMTFSAMPTPHARRGRMHELAFAMVSDVGDGAARTRYCDRRVLEGLIGSERLDRGIDARTHRSSQ